MPPFLWRPVLQSVRLEIVPEKRRAIFIGLLLALVTLAIYWPATGFDFTNYDDPDYILLNAPVQRGITVPGIVWAFKTGHASNWHPLTWISHMADCALYGLKPGGHHLTNLLLHAANAVLLFLLLRQLTGALWRSALVAALFAWHPLHVESVAWVSERKDVLSTFFALLTIMAYARYADLSKVQGPRSKAFYVLALFCFALGLLAKPMVVTLPFVLLLLDFWPLRRMSEPTEAGTPNPSAIPLWRLGAEKVPFLALAALDCLATFWAQRGGNSVVSAAALPLGDRIANALVSYVLYLWKTVWPMNLALPYPYSHEWTFTVAAGAGLFLLLVTVVAVLQARNRSWLMVGWLWFLGTLVPVIGLVQVGSQAMADRYSYVPLIGIFIMAAWSIPEAWARWPRPGFVFGAVTAGMLMFLMAGTETQLQYWRNSVTLFTHTTQVTRDNILAEYNLGEALAREGDADDAIVHYQKAIAIHPNRVEAQYNSQLQARFNLGLIYRAQKKWAEAEVQFRACLREDPTLAHAHAALGIALVGLSRPGEALQEFQTAAVLSRSDAGEAQLLSELDSAYAEAGHFPEAILFAQKARAAAVSAKRTDLAAAADKRLEFYRAQSPQNATRNTQHATGPQTR